MQAAAHGPDPEVVRLYESPSAGEVHILTTNQGVFASISGAYKWVCEDAVVPSARTQGLLIDGADPSRWLVATSKGIFLSDDAGCDFKPVPHIVGSRRVFAILPLRDGLVLAAVDGNDQQTHMYATRDGGQTWVDYGRPIAGATVTLQRDSSRPDGVLVHTKERIVSVSAGGEMEEVRIRIDGDLVNAEFITAFHVSPIDGDVFLAVIGVAGRGRVLRSGDRGATWGVTALVPDERVSIEFDSSGERVLAVGYDGSSLSSFDAGLTWQPIDAVTPTLGCLLKSRESDVLYGCGNPYDGGDFVLARSENFGQTWTPVLERFEDAGHRKNCARDGRTYLCCRGRCPGNAETCGQPNGVMWPPECYEDVQRDDAGQGIVADAGGSNVEPRVDASESADLPGDDARIDSGVVDQGPSPRADGSPSAMQSKRQGCSQLSPDSSSHILFLFGLFMILIRCKPSNESP